MRLAAALASVLCWCGVTSCDQRDEGLSRDAWAPSVAEWSWLGGEASPLQPEWLGVEARPVVARPTGGGVARTLPLPPQPGRLRVAVGLPLDGERPDLRVILAVDDEVVRDEVKSIDPDEGFAELAVDLGRWAGSSVTLSVVGHAADGGVWWCAPPVIEAQEAFDSRLRDEVWVRVSPAAFDALERDGASWLTEGAFERTDDSEVRFSAAVTAATDVGREALVWLPSPEAVRPSLIGDSSVALAPFAADFDVHPLGWRRLATAVARPRAAGVTLVLDAMATAPAEVVEGLARLAEHARAHSRWSHATWQVHEGDGVNVWVKGAK